MSVLVQAAPRHLREGDWSTGANPADQMNQLMQLVGMVTPLIGTVGRSGNARTTPPHLHIGHYVDDVADNPFPVLERACP